MKKGKSKKIIRSIGIVLVALLLLFIVGTIILRGKKPKRCHEVARDEGQFEMFKKQLIDEINELHIEGISKVEKLNALEF